MDYSNQSNDNNNWLGFSLSTKSKVEDEDEDEVVPSYGYDIGFAEDDQHTNINSGFYMMQQPHHSSFSLLPLNSDGSLCLMDQPQGMVSNSSPKLEDFLSGSTMAHHYEQETPLQLHNMYYQALEHNQFYSALSCHDIYQTAPLMEPSQHSLSLSMSPGSNSSSCTHAVIPNSNDPIQFLSNQGGVVDQNVNSGGLTVIETKKNRGSGVSQKQKHVQRKSIESFGQRTSQYRGVTRHRWTGRYEAHLWDNSCKNEGQTRKGRQVYLGGYDLEEKAARAYDLAALKYWGTSTIINFPLENYQTEVEQMKNMTRQEFVAHLRRRSSGFSRGASIYRGVTRHHQHGRWQARIGRVAGNKDLYLGTFSTQEEAAEAYDVAAIKFRGLNAVTNFELNRYDVDKIMASNTLLAAEHARRTKEKVPNVEAIEYHPISSQTNENITHPDVENKNNSNWEMALYDSSKEQQQMEFFQNSPFPMGLNNLVGTGSSVPVASIPMAHYPMFAAWNE